MVFPDFWMEKRKKTPGFVLFLQLHSLSSTKNGMEKNARKKTGFFPISSPVFAEEVHALLRGRLPLDLPELLQHGRARPGAAALVEPGAALPGAAGGRGGGAADGGGAG